MPAPFIPDRINRTDVQQLLGMVVRLDHDYTREYPSHAGEDRRPGQGRHGPHAHRQIGT
jgi:hypothetical protein